MSIIHLLEVVDSGSETQLQVGENPNKLTDISSHFHHHLEV